MGVGLNNERGVIVWKTDMPIYSFPALRYSFLTSSFSSVDSISAPSGSVDTLNMLLEMSDSYQTTALFTSTDGSLQTVYFAQLGSSGTSWSGPRLVNLGSFLLKFSSVMCSILCPFLGVKLNQN